MRAIILFILSLITLVSFGQNTVEWDFKVENEAFTAEANIAEGWHLYSQHIDNEIGPIPTSFEFDDNASIKLIGETNEPESLKEYDENFEGELNFFKENVTFTQNIKVSKATELKGFVTYMVCNDTMCLPPVDEYFTIKIDK